MKFSSLLRPTSLFLLLSLGVTACGYSQEEWDQKLRENESLTNQLKAQTDAHKKSQSDYQEAVQEIDGLKKQLADRGANLDNLNQSLAEQRKALEEYARRTEQLDAIRKRFELLQTKLQKLTQLGLKVEVRNNRMLIQLPGDVLFDSGQDHLKTEGTKILMQVAEVTDAEASDLEDEDRIAVLDHLGIRIVAESAPDIGRHIADIHIADALVDARRQRGVFVHQDSEPFFVQVAVLELPFVKLDVAAVCARAKLGARRVRHDARQGARVEQGARAARGFRARTYDQASAALEH